MTLPGLVILLVIAGVLEVAMSRRRRRSGERPRTVVGSAAVDVLGMAFAPSTRHKKEHDEFMELKRDEEGDAAPPRSTVDLDTGVAHLVLPPRHGSDDGTD
ncbi:MAG TPA: DUF6191 domain-containing protein [Candidatus Nanopelagicales bacterium]|nr:DUF6191 domain-containing protein [Candidatus Nanopelagicales bacterium]